MSNEPLNLNIDLTKVDTSMPRLSAGEYLCVIESAAITQKNDDPTKHNLLVTYKTLEEGSDQNGKPMQPGVTVRNWYPLQQSDHPNAPDYLRDITSLFMAAFGVDDQSECPGLTNENISALAGQEVIVNIKLQDSDQYGLQNRVGFVKKVS